MRSDRLPWLMLLVAAVAVAAAAAGTGVRATYGAQTTADEPHYLLTAISLAEDGDLDVADELADERYRPFHEVALPQQAASQADGSMLVPHDPLLPLLLALPVALGGWVAAKLTLALLAGALAAVTLWVAVRRFDARPEVAAVVVGLLAASPPLAQYGTQVYPELPAALAVVAAVAAASSPRPRLTTQAVVVTAVAALPWLAVKYVPVAAAVALLHLLRLARAGRRRDAVAVVAAYALLGIGYLGAHLAWYGGLTVYAAGDFFREHGGQLSVVGTRPDLLGRSRRLIGLLVDRDFGLAAWQPLWFAAVAAVAALVRRRPDGWTSLVVPAAVGWLTATFVALTMQGWWFPGRQVVVVLPLLAVAIAAWADRGGRLVVVVASGVLGLLAHAWLTVEGLSGRLTWVVDFASVGDPIAPLRRWLLPDYLRVTAATWVRHAGWLLVAAVVATVGWRGARPRSRRRRATPEA